MVVKEYELKEDINVFYVQAEIFPEDIPNTFTKLETLLGVSMKKRKIYGITACLGDKLVYRACIKEETKGEGKQYGLATYAVPKGIHLYTTLENWAENLDQIPKIFDQLMTLPNVKKQSICLEDYTEGADMKALVQQA